MYLTPTMELGILARLYESREEYGQANEARELQELISGMAPHQLEAAINDLEAEAFGRTYSKHEGRGR